MTAISIRIYPQKLTSHTDRILVDAVMCVWIANVRVWNATMRSNDHVKWTLSTLVIVSGYAVLSVLYKAHSSNFGNLVVYEARKLLKRGSLPECCPRTMHYISNKPQKSERWSQILSIPIEAYLLTFNIGCDMVRQRISHNYHCIYVRHTTDQQSCVKLGLTYNWTSEPQIRLCQFISL